MWLVNCQRERVRAKQRVQRRRLCGILLRIYSALPLQIMRRISPKAARYCTSAAPIELPASPYMTLSHRVAATHIAGRGRGLLSVGSNNDVGVVLLQAAPLVAALDAASALDKRHCSHCLMHISPGAHRQSCSCGLSYCSTECHTAAMEQHGHGALCGPAAAELHEFCRDSGVNFPRIAAAMLARSLAGDADFVDYWRVVNTLVSMTPPADPDDVPPAWREGYALVRKALSANMEGDTDSFWACAFDVRTHARLMGTLRLNSFAVTLGASDTAEAGGVGTSTTLAWGSTSSASATTSDTAAAVPPTAANAAAAPQSAAGAACGDSLADCGAPGACSPAHFKEPGGGTALFGALSLVNHSCDPNAIVTMFPRGTVTLSALRPLRDGEELTITYVDRGLPVVERRAQLLHGYGFECNCSRCIAESVVPKFNRGAV